MNGVFLDVDVSVGTKKAGHQLVVISWNVNYASAFAGFAQDFLDDVVMLLRPINSAAQRPDIDEITYNVERLKIILPKKIEQRRRIAAACAQVGIRDPSSAITPRRRQVLWRFPKRETLLSRKNRR